MAASSGQRYLRMPKVDRKPKHFVVDIDRGVSPAVWFVLARGLDEHLYDLGYETDVFNDCCDTDRQWVLEQDEIDFFEGLVSHALIMDEDEVRAAIEDYLEAREVSVHSIELDDNFESPTESSG